MPPNEGSEAGANRDDASLQAKATAEAATTTAIAATRTASAPPVSLFGVVLAPCCHPQLTWADFCAPQGLREQANHPLIPLPLPFLSPLHPYPPRPSFPFQINADTDTILPSCLILCTHTNTVVIFWVVSISIILSSPQN